MFSRKPKREPGIWYDPDDPELFPRVGAPDYEEKLVAGDMAFACCEPAKEEVSILIADGLDRYKDLRTPFYGYIRRLLREEGLNQELGRGKAAEIEQRAKSYPYYKEKAHFKALARIQFNQPIPVRGKPGEFWWSPKELVRLQPIRGGTPEERQECYDTEAEQSARLLILLGQFKELQGLVDADNSWLREQGL